MSVNKVSILGEGKLSEHLTKAEVRRVSSSDTTEIDAALPVLFELVRKYAGGKPLSITSAGRSRAHNTAVGGAESSEHLDGEAFDIALPGPRKKKLKQNLADFMVEAQAAGIGGFGVYPGHVHVDTERDNIKYYWATSANEHAIRHWSDKGEPLWLKNAGPISQSRFDGGPVAEVTAGVAKKDNWLLWLLLAVGAYYAAKHFKLF